MWAQAVKAVRNGAGFVRDRARRATKSLSSNLGARELLAAFGLLLLWRGIGEEYGLGFAEIAVGSLLVYAGLWHSLVVILAMGAARRHK